MEVMQDGTHNGKLDLIEFLVGVSQFCSSHKDEKDQRVRAFAFHMMDLKSEGFVDIVRSPRPGSSALTRHQGHTEALFGARVPAVPLNDERYQRRVG